MLSAITNLFKLSAVKTSKPRHRQAGLTVESLEKRDLMSYGVSLAGGVLRIEASDFIGFYDQVKVTTEGSQVVVDWVEDEASFGHNIQRFDMAQVQQIDFFGFGGNDSFVNSTHIKCRAFGGDGADTLIGGTGRDTLSGGDGADYLHGASGNDRLFGNEGDDRMNGGTGHDYLSGGSGNDTMSGGYGRDTLYGNLGDDLLHGDQDNDRLFGNEGWDTVNGGDGDDWLEAGSALEPTDLANNLDFNAHVTAYSGAKYSDIRQGNVGNCWLLAAIGSVARSGVDLSARISYLGNFTYRVRMFTGPNGSPTHEDVHFDGKLVTYIKDGAKLQVDPSARVAGESWAIIMQRALFQRLGINWRDGNAIPSGHAGDSMQLLTGRSTHTMHPAIIGNYSDADRQYIANALIKGRAVAMGTRHGAFNTWHPLGSVTTPKLVAAHEYVVVAVGTDYVDLYNPHGVDSGEATGNIEDGRVRISWDEFRNSVGHIYVN